MIYTRWGQTRPHGPFAACEYFFYLFFCRSVKLEEVLLLVSTSCIFPIVFSVSRVISIESEAQRGFQNWFSCLFAVFILNSLESNAFPRNLWHIFFPLMGWHTKTLLTSAAPPLSHLRSHCAPTSLKVCQTLTASLCETRPVVTQSLGASPHFPQPRIESHQPKCVFHFHVLCRIFRVLTLRNPIDLEVVYHGLREQCCSH